MSALRFAVRAQHLVCLVILVAATFSGTSAGDLPRLYTNESYVEEVTRTGAFAVDDPIAVFAYVFESLPERVKVYPTENYYYFRFVVGGVPYAGNIRLDPLVRDEGKVQFGYYPDLSEWKDKMTGDSYLVLDAARGVTVERIEPLVYRVAYRGKSVVFVLNDLSQVKPPVTGLGPDEKFLGPIFDESAMRFFLVYNTKLKIFHYILDETVGVADELVRLARTDRILVGRRTGFAYYRDHRRERKILIGVFESNSRLNTYFDGPFDQLPDNFIVGEELRSAIIEADPRVKGQIDRLGHFANDDGRYVIQPYVLYRKESDLLEVDKCATSKLRATTYYRCFVSKNDG